MLDEGVNFAGNGDVVVVGDDLERLLGCMGAELLKGMPLKRTVSTSILQSSPGRLAA